MPYMCTTKELPCLLVNYSSSYLTLSINFEEIFSKFKEPLKMVYKLHVLVIT